jgi:acylphosphatase
MQVRRRLIVHGRVHGVGFRVFVARIARSRRVTGSARNLPDGTVEVVLEGDVEDVAAVARACEEGPRSASVTHVETFDEQRHGLRGFDVG